jgi:hypothetical protein
MLEESLDYLSLQSARSNPLYPQGLLPSGALVAHLIENSQSEGYLLQVKKYEYTQRKFEPILE